MLPGDAEEIREIRGQPDVMAASLTNPKCLCREVWQGSGPPPACPEHDEPQGGE